MSSSKSTRFPPREVFYLVEIKNLTKKYGSVTVLDNFELSLQDNSKTVLMGDSGRGKTTLLRIISGLEKADEGTIRIDGNMAYMFQEPRLLPWKSTLDNVKAFLPKEHHALAEKYLSLVGLGDALKKHPSELSGGMAQRVAFARFLAYADASDAKILLLDEPFSALDTNSARAMIELLISASENRILLLVTHDPHQAEAIGDRIINI